MSKSLQREAAYKETPDLAFAAYAHQRGLKIAKASQWQRGRATEYKFLFEDPPVEGYPNGRWDDLAVDFANSEALQFDLSVRTLKKLCRRTPHTG